MKILALDTATQSISVAVTDDQSLLSEITVVNEKTHSVKIMELIQSVLAFSGLFVQDLDGFAVSKGPGTFTGLRIGISVIKGMGTASGKPIVGISSLEAMAHQVCCEQSNLICPLIDARRGEVYGSIYRFRAGGVNQVIDEQVSAPEKILEQITGPCIFVGSGALLYRNEIIKIMGDSVCFAHGSQNVIQASTIAFLSMNRFNQNSLDDMAGLVPTYIRKSDAELNLGEKMK